MISSPTSKHNNRLVVALAGVLAGFVLGGAALAAPAGAPLESLNAANIRVQQQFFGTVWVGSDDGLAAWENGLWRRWTVADGLPVNRISSLDMDPQSHDLWIGTLGGGLVRFSAGRFDVFNQFNSGLAGDLVFGVAWLDRRVYAATNGGLSVFEPIQQSWELLVPRRSDASQQVATTLRVQDGKLVAKMWPTGNFAWNPAGTQWEAVSSSWLSSTIPSRIPGKSIDNRQSQIDNPAISILGPGSRRMIVPGDSQAGILSNRRFLPDIPAVRAAVQLASQRTPSTRLWQPAPGYSKYAWNLVEDDIIKYADNPSVVGLVAHLDEKQRYTAAAIDAVRIPAVNVALQPIDVEAPPHGRWIFRCRGDEPRRHRALFDYVQRQQIGPWLVAECDSEFDTLLRTAWTRTFARTRDVENNIVFIAHDNSSIDRLRTSPEEDPIALFLWGDARRAATILKELAAAKIKLSVVCGSQLHDPAIEKLLAEHGWRAISLPPLPAPSCVSELEKIYGSISTPPGDQSPDALACATFDGTDHLLTATFHAPNGREAVAHALLAMENDVYGEAHFEKHHGNAPVELEIFENGQWRVETITPTRLTEDSNR